MVGKTNTDTQEMPLPVGNPRVRDTKENLADSSKKVESKGYASQGTRGEQENLVCSLLFPHTPGTDHLNASGTLQRGNSMVGPLSRALLGETVLHSAAFFRPIC